MKPTNREERKKAFLNFLLLFCVTVIVVAVTIVFGMQIPFKQNEQLLQKNEFYEKQHSFSELFLNKMNETKGLLDSVNRAEVQAELIDGKISENLKKMNAMIDKDSLTEKAIYQRVVLNFADLQAAKKGLRNASGDQNNLSQLQQQIVDLRGQLQAAQSQASAYQMQVAQLQAALQRPR